MRRLLLPFSLLLAALSLQAAPYHYRFNHFETRDGLPSNTVYCVVQDRFGYIWIGTSDGICCYDGYLFTYMGWQSPMGLMRDRATALCVDADGLVWFSTASGNGYYDPATGGTTSIGIQENNPCRQIVADADGCVWFLFPSVYKLYKYDKGTGDLVSYPEADFFRAVSLTVDSFGTPWCTSADGELLRYESRSDRFRKERTGSVRMVLGISGGRLLAVDNNENVLVIDPENNREAHIINCRESGGRRVLCLLERCPGEYWISTETGIRIYMEGKGITGHIKRSDRDRMSISSSHVMNLFADREGNVWIGTFYRGLDLWQNSQGAYDLFYPCDSPGSMQGRIVRAITPDPSGAIWMGTEDGGLNRYDPGTNTFTAYDLNGSYNNIQSILVQGDELWVATFGNGLFRYDPHRKRLVARITFPDNRLSTLIRTSDGAVLAGARGGLYRLAPGATRFQQVPGNWENQILALAQDSKGRIWVGSEDDGVWLLDGETGRSEHLGQGQGISESVSVTSFFEDSRHRMWVTTMEGGIFVLDLSEEDVHFRHFSRRDGLPTRNVCSMIEDEDGMLWVATIKGLFMMNPDTYQLSTVFEDPKMGVSQYSNGTAYRNGEGMIYLGTTDGVFAFNPSSVQKLHRNTDVFINSITALSGNRVTPLSSPGASPQMSDRIRVSYKDITTLNISFSSPNYSNVLGTRYECTFSSRKTDVTSVTTYNFAQYANIGYGKHTFTVGVFGNDDPLSKKSVEIIVVPPFWKSIVGRIILGLILLAAGILLLYLLRSRRKVLQERQLEKIEQMRQREMYESRNTFFTNITHEIRTPLTLIKMPLDRIIRTKEYAPSAEKDMLLIQDNTNRLLTLTNQLLDLKKLEKRDEKLEFTRQNICDTVRETCARFAPSAAEQEVDLKVSVPDEIIDMMYAKSSVDTIISNLLSNALKYGDNLIKVSLERPSEQKVAVRVDSNGRRIPESEKEMIFEKFYQSGKGTGLGLTLARVLAELHGGRLYLDTDRKDMNSFVLELPVDHPEQVEVLPSARMEEEKEIREYDSTRSSLLIAEDNQDFRMYLAREFGDEYNVF